MGAVEVKLGDLLELSNVKYLIIEIAFQNTSTITPLLPMLYETSPQGIKVYFSTTIYIITL